MNQQRKSNINICPFGHSKYPPKVWDPETNQMLRVFEIDYSIEVARALLQDERGIIKVFSLESADIMWPTGITGYHELKKKNWTIYEHDIVTEVFKDTDGVKEYEDEIFGLVVWDKRNCMFGIQTKDCGKGETECNLCDLADKLIIHGNLYENPELVEMIREKTKP